jgi:hypothetical protein
VPARGLSACDAALVGFLACLMTHHCASSDSKLRNALIAMPALCAELGDVSQVRRSIHDV